MTDEEFNQLVKAEAARRGNNWTPAEEWQFMMEVIGGTEEAKRRNTKEGCLSKQARILASMAEHSNRENQK